jgi:alpha-L-arabinofuranosidase
MKRRDFLKTSSMGAAAFVFSSRSMWAKSVDAHVELLLDESKGEISPNLYGHFTEHTGGVIYDGVWVGEKSKVLNQSGIRSQLVELLKQIHVPVVRWPGGCFADSYDWKDRFFLRTRIDSSRPQTSTFLKCMPSIEVGS